MSFDERIEKFNEVQRGWVNAQSPILETTITVERLKKRGYVSLLELYTQIKPVKWDETLSLGFLRT
jgi:hypothetical protein